MSHFLIRGKISSQIRRKNFFFLLNFTLITMGRVLKVPDHTFVSTFGLINARPS